MSADFNREKEHAFVTVEKDLKAGNIPRVVLLCGKEEYLIQWYTEALIKKYVSDASRALDFVTLQGEALTFEKICESLETVSLMSERKVVLVPDFLPAGGKALKGFPESDVKKLIDYFKDIPDESLLILTVHEDEEYKSRSNKVKTAVGKNGKVYDFRPLNDRLLRSFIEKRFRTAAKAYMPSVINTIISVSGYGNKAIEYSLYNLENDLKKIIAYSDGEITEADIHAVLSVSPENNVFAMLDAIGKNRKDEAFRLLHNLLISGTPIFNLVRMITNQLELILSVKEMKELGMSLVEMQKRLGIHQFRVKKTAALSGQYSREHLRQILASAYEIDENIKTGLLDGELALEFFIAKI